VKNIRHENQRGEEGGELGGKSRAERKRDKWGRKEEGCYWDRRWICIRKKDGKEHQIRDNGRKNPLVNGKEEKKHEGKMKMSIDKGGHL